MARETPSGRPRRPAEVGAVPGPRQAFIRSGRFRGQKPPPPDGTLVAKTAWLLARLSVNASRRPTMTVLAKTKPSELHAGYLLAHVMDIDQREHPQHADWLRTAMLLAGVPRVGPGLVLGLAVAWNQLARALPLAALLHRPRALRAGVLIVLGLGLGLLGRAGSRPRRRGDRLTRAGSIAIATVIILAAGTAPALALDATGTWSGQSICRQRAGKMITTERRSSTMMITQRAAALFVEIDGTPYRGRSRPSGHGATRARSAVSYAAGGERPSDTSAVVRLRIHIDESRGMSRLVAESSLHDGSGHRHCRYRFERTRREDPGMAPSPPPRAAFCGDGGVDRALNEGRDSDATGTPCDRAGSPACSCPHRCEPHPDGLRDARVRGPRGGDLRVRGDGRGGDARRGPECRRHLHLRHHLVPAVSLRDLFGATGRDGRVQPRDVLERSDARVRQLRHP